MAKVDKEVLLEQVIGIKDKAFVNELLAFLLGNMTLLELHAMRSLIDERMKQICITPTSVNLCEDCLYEAENDCIGHPRCLPKNFN